MKICFYQTSWQTFQALALFSDEMSAFQICHAGSSTFINSVDKNQLSHRRSMTVSIETRISFSPTECLVTKTHMGYRYFVLGYVPFLFT